MTFPLPLVILGYFLLYGLPPVSAVSVLVILHHIDKNWTQTQTGIDRMIAFKGKWFFRLIAWGLPIYVVLLGLGMVLVS